MTLNDDFKSVIFLYKSIFNFSHWNEKSQFDQINYWNKCI